MTKTFCLLFCWKKNINLVKIVNFVMGIHMHRGVFGLKSDPLVCDRNSHNDSNIVGLSRKVRPDLDLAGSYVDYVDYLFVKICKLFSCPLCKGTTPEIL